MKFIRLYKQVGSIDQVDLHFEDIPIPEPKENETHVANFIKRGDYFSFL